MSHSLCYSTSLNADDTVQNITKSSCIGLPIGIFKGQKSQIWPGLVLLLNNITTLSQCCWSVTEKWQRPLQQLNLLGYSVVSFLAALLLVYFLFSLYLIFRLTTYLD